MSELSLQEIFSKIGENHEEAVDLLCNNYLEATEWNLATLDEMLERKSSAKSSIARQKSICLQMLENCYAYTQCPWWTSRRFRGSLWSTSTRVRRIFALRDALPSAHLDPRALAVCLDAWIEATR